MNTERIPIIVVEDEPLERKGIVSILEESCNDFCVVGQAVNGHHALELIEKLPCEVLLSDIDMSGGDGIELAEKVHARFPDIVTLFITGHDNFAYAQASIRLQIFDYILKPIDPFKLNQALNRAASEVKRRRKETNQQHLFQIHLSGKMSQLYSIIMGQEIIVALKAQDNYAVSRIIESVIDSIHKSSSDIEEQIQIAYLTLYTFFSLYPDLKNSDAGNILEDLNQCTTLDAIKEIFYKNFLAIMEKLGNDGSRATTLNRIKQYIIDHYSEDISLKKLSGEFNLNPTYVSDLFKQISKQNYLEFVQEVRIQVAFDLLQKTKLKIYEIAELVGYQDSNYFVRAFKKEVGMTPKEFRDKMS